MPRVGLTRQALIAEAAEIVDAAGPDALTLAALAKRVGTRSPSLYNHLRGLDDLRHALALQGLRELASELARAAAGRTGHDAMVAVARAYRRYARRHPGLYALTQRAGSPSSDVARAAEAAVAVVTAVLRGYGLDGDEALHATRALRSALHGFVTLEAGGGFGLPLDRDISFERMLVWLDAGLESAGGGG